MEGAEIGQDVMDGRQQPNVFADGKFLESSLEVTEQEASFAR